MNESALMHHIMLGAADVGIKLFRNQTGTYKLADGRYLTSGLCKGSSDLIGWKPVKITQAMVGKTIAVFCAVEVKSPDPRYKNQSRPTREQQNFIDAIVKAGGIAFSTNNLDSAMAQLN